MALPRVADAWDDAQLVRAALALEHAVERLRLARRHVLVEGAVQDEVVGLHAWHAAELRDRVVLGGGDGDRARWGAARAQLDAPCLAQRLHLPPGEARVEGASARDSRRDGRDEADVTAEHGSIAEDRGSADADPHKAEHVLAELVPRVLAHAADVLGVAIDGRAERLARRCAAAGQIEAKAGGAEGLSQARQRSGGRRVVRRGVYEDEHALDALRVLSIGERLRQAAREIAAARTADFEAARRSRGGSIAGRALVVASVAVLQHARRLRRRR